LGDCPQIVLIHRADWDVAVHVPVAVRLRGVKFFGDGSRAGEFPPAGPRLGEGLVLLVDQTLGRRNWVPGVERIKTRGVDYIHRVFINLIRKEIKTKSETNK
jgi:hypothetical protein